MRVRFDAPPCRYAMQVECPPPPPPPKPCSVNGMTVSAGGANPQSASQAACSCKWMPHGQCYAMCCCLRRCGAAPVPSYGLCQHAWQIAHRTATACTCSLKIAPMHAGGVPTTVPQLPALACILKIILPCTCCTAPHASCPHACVHAGGVPATATTHRCQATLPPATNSAPSSQPTTAATRHRRQATLAATATQAVHKQRRADGEFGATWQPVLCLCCGASA